MAWLYWRGKVAWVKYYEKVNGETRMVRKSLKTKSPEEAQIRVGEVLQRREDVKYNKGASEDTALSVFLPVYYEKRSKFHANTKYQDELSFKELQDRFPVKSLQDITPQIVTDLVGDLQKEGLAPGTANRRRRSILQALRWAVRNKFISKKWHDEHDWESVRKLREPKGKHFFFEPEDMAVLGPKFYGHWETVCRLAHRAWLRVGEVHHSAPEHFFPKRGTLKVQRIACDCTCAGCRHPDGIWHPKDYEEREFPIPTDLIRHLKKLIEERPTRRWFVEDEHGWRPSVAVLSAYTTKRIRAAKFQKGSIHTLRHTGITWALCGDPARGVAGMPPHVAMAYAGHNDLRTMDGYAHVMNRSRRLGKGGGDAMY